MGLAEGGLRKEAREARSSGLAAAYPELGAGLRSPFPRPVPFEEEDESPFVGLLQVEGV
jgi:hypothetical protein